MLPFMSAKHFAGELQNLAGPSSYRNPLCHYRFHKYLASCSSTWEQTEGVELRIGTVLGLITSLGAERAQSVNICHASKR